MPQPPPRPGVQPTQPRKASTQGPVSRVECPWCGHPNDFRVLAGDEAGGAGWGNQGFETGSVVDCDHCGLKSKVMAIQSVTIIKLAPHRR